MNQNNNTFIPTNPDGGTPSNNGVTPTISTGDAVSVSATQVALQAQDGQRQIDPTVEKGVTSTNPNVIICPKCGNEMKKESRYCMKCGNLNYAHPDNESMKQYAWQNIKQGHFISGANVDNKQPLSMNGNISSVSNVNPFRTCLITNVILHLLMGVALFLLFNMLMSNVSGDVSVGVIVGFSTVSVIAVIVSFIINYSFQAMFIKAGEPWWGYFVPFYCNYIMYKIALGNGWIFLTLLIPVVGLIVLLIAFYNLGKKFYKSGLLTMFFPFVMIPVIAFDKNAEYSLLARDFTVSSIQVDTKGKTESERKYSRKKFIITTIVVIVLAVSLYFGWSDLELVVKKIINFFMEQLEFFK